MPCGGTVRILQVLVAGKQQGLWPQVVWVPGDTAVLPGCRRPQFVVDESWFCIYGDIPTGTLPGTPSDFGVLCVVPVSGGLRGGCVLAGRTRRSGAVFLACVSWNELCRSRPCSSGRPPAWLPMVLALSSAERLGPAPALVLIRQRCTWKPLSVSRCVCSVRFLEPIGVTFPEGCCVPEYPSLGLRTAPSLWL